MTLEELYKEIGGNYQSISERLRKEERIKKFVLLFLKDDSYQTYIQKVKEDEKEGAFRAIHTLKGVCMNLSFDELYQIANETTELLRTGDLQEAKEKLPALEKCYEKHVRIIYAYADCSEG